MSSRRKPLQQPEVVSVGCSCRHLSIPSLIAKRTKPSPVNSASVPSSTSSSGQDRFQSSDDVSSSSIVSSLSSTATNGMRSINSTYSGELPRSLGSAVAVVKASDDPYSDFRSSMVQMIQENEIYGREDLCKLLRCMLSFNSADHHDVIFRAFADAVDGILQ